MLQIEHHEAARTGGGDRGGPRHRCALPRTGRPRRLLRAPPRPVASERHRRRSTRSSPRRRREACRSAWVATRRPRTSRHWWRGARASSSPRTTSWCCGKGLEVASRRGAPAAGRRGHRRGWPSPSEPDRMPGASGTQSIPRRSPGHAISTRSPRRATASSSPAISATCRAIRRSPGTSLRRAASWFPAAPFSLPSPTGRAAPRSSRGWTRPPPGLRRSARSFLVLLDDFYRDPATGEQRGPARLDEAGFADFVDTVHGLARRSRDAHGLRLVFHPHCDATIEEEDDIERFLAATDPGWSVSAWTPATTSIRAAIRSPSGGGAHAACPICI